MKTAASLEPTSIRVLLTGDTAGGVWTFVTDLAAGLLETGADVMLGTFGPSVSQTQKQQAASIPGLSWRHFQSKLEWMDDPWLDVERARQWLTDRVNEFQPDLLHLNTLCHGDLACGVPILQTVHSCVASWWGAVRQTPLPSEWDRYLWEVERCLSSATLLTVPSEAAFQQLITSYHVNGNKAIVIYNGRNSNGFQAAVKEPIVFSAARLWDEAKNINLLAQVARDVVWPISLAGNPVGPFDSEAIFSGCHLLGELGPAELSAWYGRAALYVLPAKYEPFGLSALEAGLSGCALILGNIPSLREIWQDAALFVSPSSQADLKTALARLIAEADLRAEMSRRAYQRAGEFTRERMVVAYRRAYASIVEGEEKNQRRYACDS